MVYLVLGTALDGISMIVLTSAVVLPMIQKAGFDLVWFGIFVVLLVEIAEVTPPVGFNLFVLQNMTGKDSNVIAKAAIPFFFCLVLCIALITLFPGIVTVAAQRGDGRGEVARSMLPVLAICVGASLGALARWGLGLWLSTGASMPYGTLASNLIGGYLVGVAVAVFQAMPQLDPVWRLLLITGFLGGAHHLLQLLRRSDRHARCRTGSALAFGTAALHRVRLAAS